MHTACAKARRKGSSRGKQMTQVRTWVFHLTPSGSVTLDGINGLRAASLIRRAL